MSGQRSAWRGIDASAAALICCAVLSAGWLTLGVVVAVAATSTDPLSVTLTEAEPGGGFTR